MDVTWCCAKITHSYSFRLIRATQEVGRFNLDLPHHTLTCLFTLGLLPTSHGELQNLEGVRFQAEYPLLWFVSFPPEEFDHHSALVQGVQDLRDFRCTGERHTRHSGPAVQGKDERGSELPNQTVLAS